MILSMILKMSLDIQYGEGITPYYSTIINTTVSLCQFLDGSKSNVFLDWILSIIGETLPKNFIHPCPYIGVIKAYNVTLAANSVFPQFLKGRYKEKLRLFDELDENVVTFFLSWEMWKFVWNKILITFFPETLSPETNLFDFGNFGKRTQSKKE